MFPDRKQFKMPEEPIKLRWYNILIAYGVLCILPNNRDLIDANCFHSFGNGEKK